MNIPKSIQKVIDRINGAGGRALLVGGAVVDIIQGRDPKDWDLEVHGLELCALEDALAEFAPCEVGRSFGIFKVRVEGFDVDLSIPRRDNRTGSGHKGFTVECDPTLTPKEAARRRDFTINSLFLDLETGDIVDPFGGLADLEAGILRATDPAKFVEDPLRALRAVQLLARKAQPVDPATVELIRGKVGEFDTLPRERVFEEWSKLLLKAEKPSIGLEFLRECGWLVHFPELEALIDCPQNPEWHPEGDVWIHNCLVVDAAAQVRHEIPEDWRLAFMLGALLHDVGKPSTTVLPVCTAHGHDAKGVPIARAFLDRITNQTELISRVEALVLNHLRPFQLVGKAKPAAWKRLHRKVGRLDVLGWLSRADWAGRGGRDPLTPAENGVTVEHPASEACFSFFNELGDEPIKPVILGRHLIAEGHKPGRAFAPALAAAFEAQLDNPEWGQDELLKVAVGSI